MKSTLTKAKTKAQLQKLSRAKVIEEYETLVKEFREQKKEMRELEESHASARAESHKHLEDIAALQARCQTLRYQGVRQHERKVALEHISNGLKMFEMFERASRMFDIRSADVLNRISELLRKTPIDPPVPIHVCPMCGKITRVEEGMSGERICEKCREEAGWPWVGEIMWRHNEEGELVGICRGEYRHPDGGSISIEEHFMQAE